MAELSHVMVVLLVIALVVATPRRKFTMAKHTSMSASTKSDFLQAERRWLSLANGYEIAEWLSAPVSKQQKNRPRCHHGSEAFIGLAINSSKENTE